MIDVFAGGGGTNVAGNINSLGTFARFKAPRGLTFNSIENVVYVADYNNHQIRRVQTANAAVSTLAGAGCGKTGGCGNANGVGTFAGFFRPYSLTFDAARNAVYVSDSGNNLIRSVSLTSTLVTTLAGCVKGCLGAADGVGTSVALRLPTGLALVNTTLFFADSGNYIVRSMSLSSKVVSTLAGASGTSAYIDGIGTFANFVSPQGLAYDANRQVVYVADGDFAIRVLSLRSNVVKTLAGGGYGIQDGLGTLAQFDSPTGLAYDSPHDLLYVTEIGNSLLRSVMCASGLVSTVAGTMTPGAVNGVGTFSSFNIPFGLTFDGNGVLFIADSNNNLIRTVKVGIPITNSPTLAPVSQSVE